MSKFHTYQFYSILFIFCTINCIAKSVCTTVSIAYSASNVKQRMAGGCPPCTGYTQPTVGGRPPVIGGCPSYTWYTPPMAGWHPPAIGWVYCVSGKSQRDAGWLLLLIINGQTLLSWLPLFFYNTHQVVGNVVCDTGAVSP